MNILLIIFYMVFITSVISFISLAPWVPTFKKDLSRINKILKLEKKEKFLEIWCWTSWVSLFIAKNNPDSFITGIELSPFFYMISKIRIYFSWLKNIKIIYWNALNTNLENYDAIYVFWLPESITNKIFPKISNNKNKKFRFVSYCFQMKNNYFQEKKYKTEGDFAIYKYFLD